MVDDSASVTNVLRIGKVDREEWIGLLLRMRYCKDGNACRIAYTSSVDWMQL